MAMTNAERVRRWRELNPERNRRYYHKYPDKAKNKALRRNYGITLDQWKTMLAGQNNACDLCKSTFLSDDKIVVDHCHKTKKVRGLLHSKCNIGIGHFGDDPAKALMAYEYLTKHRVA